MDWQIEWRVRSWATEAWRIIIRQDLVISDGEKFTKQIGFVIADIVWDLINRRQDGGPNFARLGESRGAMVT